MQVDLGGDAERLRQIRFATRFQRRHRGFQHVRIELKADLLHLTRLLFAQHFAGAANFEIVHREIEP